jgi:cobalamin synthase
VLGTRRGLYTIAVTQIAGRLAPVWVMRTFGYARLDGGTGRAFFEATTGWHLAVSGVPGSALAFAWLKYAGLLGLAVDTMMAGLCATAISPRPGGQTGDTVGAMSEGAEVAFLLELIAAA